LTLVSAHLKSSKRSCQASARHQEKSAFNLALHRGVIRDGDRCGRSVPEAAQTRDVRFGKEQVMSQQKSSPQAKSAAPTPKQHRWRRRVMLGLAIGLSLFTALGIGAQQRARQAPRKTEPSARPASVMAPSSLTPSAPAKEYIYAGGKLLATEEPRFEDVPISHPYYSDIDKIAERGITSGCTASPPNYCPNAAVTRVQMAVFIERALGVFQPPTPPATATFQDVPTTHIFYAFVEDFKNRGITSGCSGPPNPSLFCPDASITHGQMAVFMERAANYFTPPPGPATPTFCDVPTSHIFYNFIEHYAGRGIWAGCGDTGSCSGVSGCASAPKCFCSDTTAVTRGEMARILVRNFGW
jgi:hypothetical protein